MKLFTTGWSTLLTSLKDSTGAVAADVLNHAPAVVYKLDNPSSEFVTLWVKSDQDKVTFSVNPVSLEEDTQTKLMNRAIDLGYEPVTTPTVNPLSR
jgi:hypothetical protein